MTNKYTEALDRIFNFCEEIDLHLPKEEQTGYSMLSDISLLRDAIYKLEDIVYCKNCEFCTGFSTSDGIGFCAYYYGAVSPDYYCGCGIKRDTE